MAFSNKRYIYLAGKIKLGHGATGYRAIIAPILAKFGIYSLDPLRAKYAMQSWDSLSPNEVVVRDLQDIDRAHCMLAVSMKCEDASFGTPCEIMYAWMQRTPVILITNEAYLAKHFWVRGLCSHVVFIDEEAGETLDEALLKVATHIGHWYGELVEEEVYNNPTMAQEATPLDGRGCDCADCAGCDGTCSQGIQDSQPKTRCGNCTDQGDCDDCRAKGHHLI
jgi:nucleoside 2-deoxyribosyltransferase